MSSNRFSAAAVLRLSAASYFSTNSGTYFLILDIADGELSRSYRGWLSLLTAIAITFLVEKPGAWALRKGFRWLDDRFRLRKAEN